MGLLHNFCLLLKNISTSWLQVIGQDVLILRIRGFQVDVL